MNIALCYESVLPARGGCETYITDLSRRLIRDRHDVHLYACRWDESALPKEMHFHRIPEVKGPRFLRPWRFGQGVLDAVAANQHDVTVGFDKAWGLDVLYPQGGLHAASAEHNLHKYRSGWMRKLTKWVKALDPAHRSYSRLERQQYLSDHQPTIVVNSYMVRGHFQRYYGIGPERLRVVRSAIDPNRFVQQDRPKRRLEWRQRWGFVPNDVVGLLAAMNYRLKGLEPTLYSLQRLLARPEYQKKPPDIQLLVAGNSKTARYQRLAKRLGVAGHVSFIGHCAEMRNAYFAADFLMHPTFYDPCSLVVLEAFACGLPVITSRSNGASELMRPLQEGYVVDDPHDHDHMAWCMSQFLDKDRLAASSSAARKTGQQWTFDKHYEQLLSVFTEAAQRKRAA